MSSEALYPDTNTPYVVGFYQMEELSDGPVFRLGFVRQILDKLPDKLMGKYHEEVSLT